jgi:nucleotide-binding universal stress UspA family protein
MTHKNILVPIDFSDVTETTVKMAVYFAKLNNSTVSLLHIETKKSVSDPEIEMQNIANRRENSSVTFKFIIKKGNIYEDISKIAGNGEFGFMIIGTHGHKGFREKLLGADILKLLRTIPIPVFTVQKNCPIPENGFTSILFPVGSHEHFIHNILATIDFASIFDAEVHLYSIDKPGTELSDKMCENIRLAKSEFEKNNVKYKRVKDSQHSFSVGFAKQIVEYGKNENIDLIVFMANSTAEHYYIADSDKEYMLTNKAGIPVLTTNDKRIV